MVVAIGEIITNGIIFDVKNWQTHPMNTNKLLEAVDDLFNTLIKRLSYFFLFSIALLFLLV
jgi:hypothetical protein